MTVEENHRTVTVDPRSSDLATAMHESGHAIAFLACGVRFDYATIRLPDVGETTRDETR